MICYYMRCTVNVLVSVINASSCYNLSSVNVVSFIVAL